MLDYNLDLLHTPLPPCSVLEHIVTSTERAIQKSGASIIKYLSMANIYRACECKLPNETSDLMIYSGKFLKNVYEILEQLAPGLILDVGAAIGMMSQKFLIHSARSKVIAFEPYPGNIEIFKRRINDSRITLIEKAVSDRSGTQSFFVPMTRSGCIPHVGTCKNYSSSGFLNAEKKPITKRQHSTEVKVNVTTIDRNVSEPVKLLKIDVQGGEAAVLRGANKLIMQSGVDVIQCEFSGSKEVLFFLLKRDYQIFDTDYFIVPRDITAKKLPSDWIFNRKVELTSGKVAYYGRPKNVPSDPTAYSEYFYSLNKEYGYVQTDILALRKGLHIAR